MSEQQVSTATSIDSAVTNNTGNELVPGVKAEILPYQEASPEKKQNIEKLLAEIDMSDTHSIIFFGSKAQEQLTSISDRMLEGVKNKDVGPAGSDLNEMVAIIRGFEVDDLDPNKKQGFFDRMFGKAKPVVKFLQQYEEVRKQIDTITDKLEKHKTSLLTDITSLDRLYQANLEYFYTLEDYIAAGEEKLRQLDDTIIPEHAKQAETSQEIIAAQTLRDLRAARDDLERRVHDLRLTRQVSMQSLPGIRLVQEMIKAWYPKSIRRSSTPYRYGVNNWRRQ